MPSWLDSLIKKSQSPKSEASQQFIPEQECGDCELRLALCKIIIDRYREEIERGESKTIADLLVMVSPSHPVIEKIKASILADFLPYSYEKNFIEAAKMCFQYVSSFRTISPPVAFWLSFQEMQSIMAGDEIDKSILLCSLLRSLGSPNAKVFVTSTKNSYVVFEFDGKFYLLGHSGSDFSPFASESEAASQMKGKPIYSFNDRGYFPLEDD